MSYSDVMRFWCSPYECYKINELDLMSSRTPIIIEGARGSGKTMILKHLSYFCQKESFNHEHILQELANSKYLGIYFRYSADYSSLFDTLNCSKVYRDYLFTNYFHLCVCLELAKIIKDFELQLKAEEKKALFDSISVLCSDDISDATTFMLWLEKNIRQQDELIRKSQYTNIIETQENQQNSLLFDVITTMQTSLGALQDTLFIIIIDEYENVGDYQYIINTLLKQMEGHKNYTFRIGVRPEGIRDYRTKISGEFLQDGRDFLKKSLIINSNDRSKNYSKFVKSVINRRLSMIPIFNQSNTSIDDLLGKKENYDWEASYHVKGRKEHFSDVLTDKSSHEREQIISVVSDDNPIIEAYYLMRYKRGESLENIQLIKEENKVGAKTANTKKYRLDMQDKYKAALLFWLIDKYKANKLYYGFDTYLYLSCGSIYDFIGLCRTAFDELESDYFESFDTVRQISPFIQSKAAKKYAESQMEKVRINHEYGSQMHRFTQNMCSLFKFYHKGDLCIRYPETNQFYIAGDFESSGVNKEIWRSLIRWGIIIKKTSYQRASLSVGSRAQLYYVNKSYYPIFGISCRIRGGFNFALTNEIWDDMITHIVDPVTVVKNNNKESKKAKTSKNILIDTPRANINACQLSLFNMEDSDE